MMCKAGNQLGNSSCFVTGINVVCSVFPTLAEVYHGDSDGKLAQLGPVSDITSSLYPMESVLISPYPTAMHVHTQVTS